jgi:ribosomal protein L44E
VLAKLHPTLARELRQSKRLQKFFNSLPESSRHQIDREVKKEETRLRCAQYARSDKNNLLSVNQYCGSQPPSAAL